MTDQDQPRESSQVLAMEQMSDIPTLLESDTVLAMSAEADETNAREQDDVKQDEKTVPDKKEAKEKTDEDAAQAPFDLDDFDNDVVDKFNTLKLGQEQGDVPSDLAALSKEAKEQYKHKLQNADSGTIGTSVADATTGRLVEPDALIHSLGKKDGVENLITMSKKRAKAQNEFKMQQGQESKEVESMDEDLDQDDAESSAPELDPVDALKSILWKMTMNQYQDKMVRLKLSEQIQLKATLTTADTSRAILEETRAIGAKQVELDKQFEIAKKKLPDDLVVQIIANHAKDSVPFRNILPL